MTDLLTRLQRLSGDNPVAFVKLVPEDWPEISELIQATEVLSQQAYYSTQETP